MLYAALQIQTVQRDIQGVQRWGVCQVHDNPENGKANPADEKNQADFHLLFFAVQAKIKPCGECPNRSAQQRRCRERIDQTSPDQRLGEKSKKHRRVVSKRDAKLDANLPSKKADQKGEREIGYGNVAPGIWNMGEHGFSLV
ncbi:MULTISPECIES: hypothetical protein [Roseobacteraceae]|uniref:hypothetical protein n=1 Tax=Roseobacteraceae TaxID=2854170 RepID=UPI00125F0FEA|nr:MULTISPECIES: hypothetical protein [Roseobacteraceae]